MDKKIVFPKYENNMVMYDGSKESEKTIIEMYEKAFPFDRFSVFRVFKDSSRLLIIGETKWGLYYMSNRCIDVGNYVVYERVPNEHMYHICVYTKEEFEKEYSVV